MAKIIERNNRSAIYAAKQAGKTYRQVEYGVLFPDGTIEWNEGGFASSRNADISTEEGRKLFVDDWERQFENIHAPIPARPRFLKRIRTVKYSEPEHIVD